MKNRLKSIYRGKVIDLSLESVRLPNGHVAELEIVYHPGAAAVVPFLDQENVILIKQYRHAIKGYLYEIPAGKLAKNETPLKCARRELEEEIGYTAARLQKLASIYTSPGFCDERIHLFAATRLSKTRQDLESCEVLEVKVINFQKVLRMIEGGEIQDAKSIVGLELAFWWKQHRLNK